MAGAALALVLTAGCNPSSSGAPGTSTGASPSAATAAQAATPTAAATATGMPEGSFEVGVPGPGMSGCLPTRGDDVDPQYAPTAPDASVVGSGYVLEGAILAAGTCLPVADALVELWMHAPEGGTEVSVRGSTATDATGAFAFQTDVPAATGDESPHIHLRVSAPGFEAIFLRHYPAPGAAQGAIAVVLKPE